MNRKNKENDRLLKLDSIKKYFPGVEALKGISFSLKRGKVYGLVGENGAGKSTLIKILMGVYKPNEGKIFIKKKKVNIKNPYQARHEFKIDAAFQERALIPQLSVAENIFLDRLDNFYSRGGINRTKLQNRAKEVLDKVALDVDAASLVGELSGGEEKLVELSKVLSRDPDIVIMDEVTAPLDSSEVKNLFKVMKGLKERGKTIIFISHRLDEVLEICDDIIVLRDGNLEGVINNSGKSTLSIRKVVIRMMTGTKTGLSFPIKKGLKVRREKIFSLRNIRNNWLKDVSLDIYKGEIVALAGLRNQGQSKLLRTIFGLIPKDGGDIYLNGKKLEINNPKEAVNHGIFYISDRRDQEELWLTHDVQFNTSLVSLGDRALLGFIRGGEEKKAVEKIISELGIETPSLAQIIRNLSGGNRQKIVLGKYMLAQPKVLFADQPAQGLDVKAKEEIYYRLRDLSSKGIPVLTVLTEMSEVMNLPDRVIVMRDGEFVQELAGKKIDEEKLLDSYYG